MVDTCSNVDLKVMLISVLFLKLHYKQSFHSYQHTIWLQYLAFSFILKKTSINTSPQQTKTVSPPLLNPNLFMLFKYVSILLWGGKKKKKVLIFFLTTVVEVFLKNTLMNLKGTSKNKLEWRILYKPNHRKKKDQINSGWGRDLPYDFSRIKLHMPFLTDLPIPPLLRTKIAACYSASSHQTYSHLLYNTLEYVHSLKWGR